MPVVITFDIEGAPSSEHNRLQSMFERLGWQTLGGSSYRYPSLGTAEPVEDWFNHVIPAMMLFRSYIQKSNRPLTKFTLDAQASTGYNPASVPVYGHPPLAVADIKYYKPHQGAFGLKNLKDWFKKADSDFPY
jgi:hypothetical protein